MAMVGWMQKYKVGWVCHHFTHHHSSDFLMPCKKAEPKKKQALGMKDTALSEIAVRSSARRAAARSATWGNKNILPMMAATPSVASSGMPQLTNNLLLTALTDDTTLMPAIAEASQDSAPVAMDMVTTSLASEEVQDSEIAILCGE
jgi:hypothetical protein